MTNSLWERIKPLIPPQKAKKKAGRPRMEDRLALNAIFYVLRTGCHWKALPRCLGAASTVHDRFQEWTQAGLFAKMWRKGLLAYNQVAGIDWQWQSMDGAMNKAPLGGEKTGPNPTDRAKQGTKRSLLTDGAGIPLGIEIEGANRNDMKMVDQTLASIPIERPEPTAEAPQHLCLDKGYDYDEVRETVAQWGYTAHIRSRGEEQIDKASIPNYRSRRWVVERTFSWMNRFRRILVRWEKKSQNFLALVHFSCAFIAFRAAERFL
ncbi:IS5 family transposase [Chloroflexi bacterium TSY]|nr:IS5 family transposase [Chloroflexi bacterium TSY]